MRTLGPHSVSSALKIILDVVFVILLVAIVWLGVVAAMSTVAMNNPTAASGWVYPGTHFPVVATSPRRARFLVIVCIHVLASIVVVGRLRKIFVTLVAGAPFQAENARRLRVIGLTLLGAEVARLAVHAIVDGIPQGARLWLELNYVGWFGIAIIFVLAEVFDEGARLRREAELTI